MKRKIPLVFLAALLVGTLLAEALALKTSIANRPKRSMPYVALRGTSPRFPPA